MQGRGADECGMAHIIECFDCDEDAFVLILRHSDRASPFFYVNLGGVGQEGEGKGREEENDERRYQNQSFAPCPSSLSRVRASEFSHSQPCVF